MAFDDTAGMLANALDLPDSTEEFAAGGWLAQLEATDADLAGAKPRRLSSALVRERNKLAAMVDQGVIQGYFNPLLDQMAEDIAWKDDGRTPLWAAIYDYMRANTKSFKERDLTFGSTTFSGTGTGTLIILSADEQGHEMQGVFADAYALTCTKDGRETRFSGNEQFTLAGTPAAVDGLDLGGVGPLGTLRPLTPSPSDTRNVVTNAMFQQREFSTGVTISTLTGWTITGSGDLTADTTNLYWSSANPLQGVSTYNSLNFANNKKIAQDITNDARKSLVADRPYVMAVILRRNDTADGNAVLTFGNQSRTVAMSSLTDDQWAVLLVPASTGANNWFLNVNQNDMTVSIEQTSNTTGSFSVAGVIFAPMQRMGYLAGTSAWGGRGCMGHYHALIAAKAGASGFTPFVKGDNWTWTYSEANRPTVQYWAARSGYGYFRHASSPSTADV